MKTLGIWLAASMAAACASHPAPDANSGTSPAPVADGTVYNAEHNAVATTPAPTVTPTTTTATDNAGMPVVGPTNNTGAASNNVAATPAPVPAPAPAQPDNSAVNKRDKDSSALTPMNQGTSEGDRKITQQIRQAVMKDGSLSFTAKNVKIITINGKVTLRGPVKTDQERSTIEAAAKSVAGVNQVENFLEAKN